MTFVRAFALMILAPLLLAAAPASSRAITVVSARAVHTSVHPRTHGHHRHARHHHTANAELRAGTRHHGAHSRAGGPATPRPHSSSSHALPPHASSKLQRNHSPGGAPYALGHASLSLGLWTTGATLTATQNDGVTEPRLGHLKGRSPPRGNPPSAIRCCRARAVAPKRAPSPGFQPFRNARPDAESTAKARRDAPLAAESSALALRDAPLAAESSAIALRDVPLASMRSPRVYRAPSTPGAPCCVAVTASLNPGRAFEGRTAGSSLPSRRKFS